jgi:hypothetical protein
MKSLSVKTLYRFYINNIRTLLSIPLVLLTLTLTACGGGGETAPENSKFNPELSFQTSYEVNEGENITITFSLDKSTLHDVSFDYKTTDGSAIDNINFTGKNGAIVIKSGEKEASISLTTINNSKPQSQAKFQLILSNVIGANIDSAIININILDDESEPSFLGFSSPQTIASYQAGKLTIEVTRPQISNEDLTVFFSLSGTATQGFDYNIKPDTDNTANSITFASGETTAYINFTIIDNGLPRSGSVIHIALDAANNFELNDNNEHDIILAGALALNDTGALTGDDAKYGRDSNIELKKSHDGVAGFSFTKINFQGNKVADDTVNSVKTEKFSCVIDNVTGLVFETKQDAPSKDSLYNARLSKPEIDYLLNKSNKLISKVSYQDLYNTFPSILINKEGKVVMADFEEITGRKFNTLLESEKTMPAFIKITDLTKSQLTLFHTESSRVAGNTLAYPFYSDLEIQHRNWRSTDHEYYWLNEDTSTNGGRSGSLGELSDTKFPLSRFCAFPHQDLTNYVSDIKGCNSRDYLKVMNDLAVCGFTDWRLPKIEELRSLVNYQVNSQPWDAQFFPFTNSQGDYISATPSVSNDASVWCIDGSSGEVKLCHKQQPSYIQAVRGVTNE